MGTAWLRLFLRSLNRSRANGKVLGGCGCPVRPPSRSRLSPKISRGPGTESAIHVKERKLPWPFLSRATHTFPINRGMPKGQKLPPSPPPCLTSQPQALSTQAPHGPVHDVGRDDGVAARGARRHGFHPQLNLKVIVGRVNGASVLLRAAVVVRRGGRNWRGGLAGTVPRRARNHGSSAPVFGLPIRALEARRRMAPCWASTGQAIHVLFPRGSRRAKVHPPAKCPSHKMRP